ncbi:orotidine-5'-phosphate decarboxylase [Rhizosaccharibacter radicis]|uniref:Orotidine 5'-phosphate decarboxylase n=1 Tax=Rhizosaccharibacter radicis TaxID=2782605 RepID=A0ABT1W0I6_9PROT|nr:orotidine-5'-phosphate decarboxylase [Acetobacteraceae bacterium KSS12]
MTGLILALDTTSPEQAREWVRLAGTACGAVKLGLEFTLARGVSEAVATAGTHRLFLDLKLHDIPNTVRSAVRALAPARPFMLTVHAGGGAAMIAAAREAVEDAFEADARPILLAVTVLTSLDAQGLHEAGVAGGPRQQVLRLGRLAMEHGAHGLVCSPHEVSPLRDALGASPLLVVPGIRPADSAADDQKRVMTPAEARRAGADWIVVGRPITRAADPAAAAAAIAEELA